MKNNGLKYLWALLAFSLFAAIVFRVGWGGNRVFSGSDANIGLIAQSHHWLPERFTGAFTATPLLGRSSSVPVSLNNIGRWLLSPARFSDTWYGFYLVLSSLALMAYLRLWKVRWSACVLGALSAFWVGSATIAASGHLAKLGVAMLFSVALWLSEKAVRSERLRGQLGWGIVLGLAVALMLLEQQDVGLLAGLFLGPYVLFRLWNIVGKSSAKPWVAVLLPVALIGGGLSAPTALRAYSANVTQTGSQSDPAQRWNFVTQWSMVPAELPDLVAPGYTGWKTGAPKGPYWGEAGQSPEWKSSHKGFRNFRLDNLYIGFVPFFLAFWALVRARQKEWKGVAIFWGAAALAALLLAFGKYSPVYRLFYHLPLVGNIRAPIKFMHNFQIMVGILAAFGLDDLLALASSREEKAGCRTWIVATGIAALFALFALGSGGRADEFAGEWGANLAAVIAKNISLAWWHAVAAGLLLAGILWAIRKWPEQAALSALALPLFVAFDSVWLTSKYYEPVNIAGLRRGNAVINFLKENQGNERIYFVDPRGVYNSWLAMEVPYNGLHVFNIWQMPRMPEEYRRFLGASNRNPVRLWQLASVKYLLAPAGVARQLPAMKPEFYYRFVREGDGIGVQKLMAPLSPQDQVLLRFDDALPRVAFFPHWETASLDGQLRRLFAPSFNPLDTVLVDLASPPPAASEEPRKHCEALSVEIGKKRAVVQTRSRVPGIVLFTQRYQPEWKVFIDGKPAPLLRCNYLSMGVFVPKGEHKVVFSCD